MTQKERLVEELFGKPLLYSSREPIFISRKDAIVIAEDLVNRLGVIAPPCKVGNTVYDIGGFPKIMEAEVETITTDGEEMSSVVVSQHKPYHRWFVNWKDAGKFVFLTREEAEQALKERDGK